MLLAAVCLQARLPEVSRGPELVPEAVAQLLAVRALPLVFGVLDLDPLTFTSLDYVFILAPLMLKMLLHLLTLNDN